MATMAITDESRHMVFAIVAPPFISIETPPICGWSYLYRVHDYETYRACIKRLAMQSWSARTWVPVAVAEDPKARVQLASACVIQPYELCNFEDKKRVVAMATKADDGG